MNSELMAFVGFFILVSATLWGIWWRIESKVDAAKKDSAVAASAAQATANMAREELAAYKTHVAETFVSKSGHRESTEQILEAINRLNERLDRAFDHSPKRPNTRP